MGDLTDRERVIELENTVKGLESTVTVLCASVAGLVRRAEVEDEKKAAINKRMAKARAGRKRGKG